MSVPDVVSAVLGEARIPARWQLLGAHPVREYCTQYEESDYRFVTRLLAEAGIYFYFAGGAPIDPPSSLANTVGAIAGDAFASAEPLLPGDAVIFGDDASLYPPISRQDAAGAVSIGPLVGAAVARVSSAGNEALGAVSAIAGAAIAGVTSVPRSAPALYFLAMLHTATSSVDKVTRFDVRTKVAANAAQFSDYDPSRPHIRLRSSATSTKPFPPAPLEIAGAVASAAGSLVSGARAAMSVAGAVANAAGGVLGGEAPARLEVYEHHGDFLFPQWEVANDEAARILRQKRRRASIAEGESGCPDLAPGHCFTLSDHPVDRLNHAYVVTTVKHRGRMVLEPGVDWQVYANSFECAPAEVTYVPPRPKRRRAQVSLTATVVGPPGEEIWVDPHGQIKVQFHWDREGSSDDKSSCWIRTMHP
jgi:uncharacterized protein involved in type VI secretion and phage assembly